MRKPAPSYETQELREFAEVLRGRRTINLYLHTPVPEKLVHEAIEAATWAPNHHVTEPWHFILPGNETVGKILDLCEEMVTAAKDAEPRCAQARILVREAGLVDRDLPTQR